MSTFLAKSRLLFFINCILQNLTLHVGVLPFRVDLAKVLDLHAFDSLSGIRYVSCPVLVIFTVMYFFPLQL